MTGIWISVPARYGRDPDDYVSDQTRDEVSFRYIYTRLSILVLDSYTPCACMHRIDTNIIEHVQLTGSVAHPDQPTLPVSL